MQLSDIPEAFQSRIRLAIISSLIGGAKSFIELRAITGASDGNLSVHLTKLEADGYLTSDKSFQQKKPISSYAITEKGREEFTAYVALLEEILHAARREER
jgi:DNA-binding HxlR family transcriptional regulator